MAAEPSLSWPTSWPFPGPRSGIGLVGNLGQVTQPSGPQYPLLEPASPSLERERHPLFWASPLHLLELHTESATTVPCILEDFPGQVVSLSVIGSVQAYGGTLMRMACRSRDSHNG